MRPLVLTSVANPRLKALSALAMKKHRAERGVFIAEGFQQLMMAAEVGWPMETLVLREDAQGALAETMQAYALEKKSEVLVVSEAVVERLSKRDNPPLALGIFRQRFLALKDLKPKQNDVVLVLEELRDPGNVGTLIRTVDAVGANALILLGNCADVWAPECVRATMGSLFHVPLVQSSREDFLAYFGRLEGAALVGAHLKGAVDYRKMAENRPLFLALGTEQKGLTQKMADFCTQLVKIPQPGKAESLNVAVAGGLLLYEARRNLLSL